MFCPNCGTDLGAYGFHPNRVEPWATPTRYGGVYEGGAWAAFSLPHDAIESSDAFGGDVPCCVWWQENADKPWVAVGDTPQRAHENLRRKTEGN